MPLAPGQSLGPYQIVGPLGAGGMGEVYLARDPRLDREVALKILPARTQRDPDSIARFRREALTLASLNHPNLATVHGFEEDADGTLVLVLEKVDGVTLGQRIKQGALGVEESLQICAQVAEALEVAHERGVIHRDIKPGNVMIGPRGLVKVLDFGLAQRIAGLEAAQVLEQRKAGHPAPEALPSAFEDQPTVMAPPPVFGSDEAATILAPQPGAGTVSMTGMTVGTPGYMSPEQVLADPVDGRTDIFALGVVLFECLSGRRAFPGDDAIQVMRDTVHGAVDLSALPERTPARIRLLVERCLSKSADGRPGDMRDVRIELEEALGIRRGSALREGAVAVPHNLPAPATSFIGREAALAACSAALDGTRLLTLLGMGGSGKTRLALRMAETRLDEFPDGVWFVDVAPLTEGERLVEALAGVLGVRDESGRTLLQGVSQSLATARTLLMLDNAETLPGACAQLATALLATCRELKIVVTSREPLGADAETAFPVPTLAVPGAGARTAAAASAFESVLLFVARARAAQGTFELTDANAATVAEICRRLDGIPLALELAAARVKLLGVEQIRARLDDRFKLLTRGGGAGPGRQQTVLAVIQWSWDHLHESEQQLMRRLAVFAGGWTLERAVAVQGGDADEFDVLDLMTRLVDRSLVVVERLPDGEGRYHFLESVWRFAQERLASSDEEAVVRGRHLDVFVAFAGRAAAELTGPRQARAMAEVAIEEDNILAALSWCGRAEDGAEKGLRLASEATRYWSLSGRYRVGRQVMLDALARDAQARPTPLRALTLTRFAGFALTMGDPDSARPALEEALSICVELDDRKGVARAYAGLAVVAMTQERYEDALVTGAESLSRYEALGETRGVAMSMYNVGQVQSTLGRNAEARETLVKALGLIRALGDQSTEALCLSGLASAEIRLGELEPARAHLHECCRLVAQVGVAREGIFALEVAAELLVAQGRYAEGARLDGAARAARLTFGTPYMRHEEREAAALTSRLDALLGTAETEHIRAAGARLTLTQAIAEGDAMLSGPQPA